MFPILLLSLAAAPQEIRGYVQLEHSSIYFFEDKRAYLEYDLDKCQNAVLASRPSLAKLRRANRRKLPLTLRVIRHDNFFDRAGFGEGYHLNWNFHGIALNPVCANTVLLEIVSVSPPARSRRRATSR